ncbi:MAG: transposase [Gammaproteobacteria bacterium]
MDAKKYAHGERLRYGRQSIPYQEYLVTFVTKARFKYFEDYINARMAARGIIDNDISLHVETMAYVVMPDHVHWLIRLKPCGYLSRVVQLYKAKISYQIGAGLWQRGFHDRAVRRMEDTIDIARYIVANPLRSGLVDDIAEYPYWDAIWLTGY